MHLPDFGTINPTVLTRAGEAQAVDGRLSGVFGELGFASEEELLRAVADNMGYEFAELAGLKFDRSLIKSFPLKLIHRYSVYPLRRQEQTLYLATSNPFDLHALDAVGAATGLSVVPVILSPDEMGMLIKAQLGVGAETIDDLMAQADGQEGGVHVLSDFEGDGADTGEVTQEASVIRLVNEILVEAIEACASDIHLESQTSGIRIRYRIDGVLHTQPTPPEINRFHAAIISRLKIMARLNIAEKRRAAGRPYQAQGRRPRGRRPRVDHSHAARREHRDAHPGQGPHELFAPRRRHGRRHVRAIQAAHQIAPRHRARYRPHRLRQDHDAVQRALNEIKSDETKIITTEDPVEYHLDGINQIQVHAEGRSYLRRQPAQHPAPRSRRDPGGRNPRPGNRRERRPGRPDRPPGVLHPAHQRRRGRVPADGRHGRGAVPGEQFRGGRAGPTAGAHALPQVPRAITPTDEDVPEDFPLAECLKSGRGIYRAVGCRQCRGTGYHGRTGLYELLETNDEIRQLAGKRTPTHLVKQAAVTAGMHTLRDDGWRKVRQGMTTVRKSCA